MNLDPTDDRARFFVERMRAQGLPAAAIATFCHHLGELFRGGTGTLGRDLIEPVGALPDADSIEEAQGSGIRARDRVGVIKLNGGLGTGMGLDRAKSLLEVRDGLSFLDVIARQTISLRQATDSRVPVLFMNSLPDITIGITTAPGKLDIIRIYIDRVNFRRRCARSTRRIVVR